MIPGLPNTYFATPLYKMEIYSAKKTQEGTYVIDTKGGHFSVLFNPQSYRMSRTAMLEPSEKEGEVIRQASKFFGTESLSVDLFIDTFSAAAEVIGINGGLSGVLEGGKFTLNSEAPSYTKQLSAMEYANKLYDLCKPAPKKHCPPNLILKWKDSLFFPCFMKNCKVEYTKFKETGVPVRAKVSCEFVGCVPLSKVQKTPGSSLLSPDTSKFHCIAQGETLNDLSQIAYKDPSLWREVANANDIVNPRLLNSGNVLRMPAL